MGSAPCHSRQPVYLGGPVPGPLMALHDRPALAEAEPAPGVFFAAKKEHLDAWCLTEEPAYKVFVGHAGWGAGQLENELHQGAWRHHGRRGRIASSRPTKGFGRPSSANSARRC